MPAALGIEIRQEIIERRQQGQSFRRIAAEMKQSYDTVRGAVERLAAHHDITLTAVGIAQHADNIAALEAVADFIAPDVNTGLAQALAE
jgi:urease accessory protein UreF